MPNYTENYSYAEPQYGEQADIAVLNQYVTRKVDENMYQTRRMMVDGYDSTATYNTGALVEYSNALYKCLADNVTGTWDSTKWELTTLAESAGGSSSLSDLDDVDLTTPADGDILIYDDTEWKNAPLPDASVTKTAEGNPIEFDDGASAPLVKCVTAITGSQDLHGYDKPWVGGAGKNKLPLVLSDIKARNTSGTWSGNNYTRNGVTFSVITDESENITGIKATGTATANTAIDLSVADVANDTPVILNGCPSGGGEASYYIGISSLGYHCIGDDVWYNNYSNFVIYCFVPSGYAIPSGGVIFTPMVRLSTESDPTYAPYSNICPITAYTEGEIEVRGKNCISTASLSYNISYSGYQFFTFDGKKANTEYTIAFVSDKAFNCKGLWTTTPNTIYNIVAGQNIIRYKTDSDINNNFKMFFLTGTAPGEVNFTNVFIAESYISDADYQFEPYTSTTHTTTFPSAIYRGSEDCVNGEVECEMLCDDLGDFTWTKASGFSNKDVFYIPLSSLSGVPKHVIYQVPNAISSVAIATYQQAPVWGIGTFVFVGIEGVLPANTLGFIVPLGAYSDATTFKTAMTGQTLAYELATPTTSSVTPTNLPIKSLSGYTHIESSTGDMEIEYITEEYQPLVDLIEENSGKVTQNILYTASTMSETEIDVDLTAYDEYIFFANDVLATSQIPQGNSLPKAVVEYIISNNPTLVLYGYDDCSCIYTVSSNKLTYSSGRGGYRITMIVGIKNGNVTRNVQTRSISTRSLSLSKGEISEFEDKTEELPEEEEKAVNEPVEEKEEPIEEPKEEKEEVTR